MPTSRKRGPKRGTAHGKRAGGTLFFAGTGTGVALVLLTVLGYLLLGRPPVAATDGPALWEPLLTTVPLHQRVRAEAKAPPFPASEEVFEAGARLYRVHCAQCHGVPGQAAALGREMSPRAPQFFVAHPPQNSTDTAAGELFWKTAFGVRHSGMPAYNHVLSNTELWQVSLLLQASSRSLPDPVQAILRQGTAAPQPTVVVP